MNFRGGQILYLNPTVPFVESIQGGLQEGLQITVNGTVLPSTENEFHVDFRCGTSGNDIPFHFNPRFQDGGYIVCNTKQNGFWRNEERKMLMPFQKGAPLEINFRVQRTDFKASAFPCDSLSEQKYTLPFLASICGGLCLGRSMTVFGSVLPSADWCGEHCEEHCFKVIVNGQHLISYNHQVKNLPSINDLEVAGNIRLIHVQI
ncbi:galectin-9-like [Notamacropus eugenii]|uniref:galectin-9-like n=1 Tax=Notamacropus eugenii TaxID=9315 RepID=UPI003B671AA0